MNKGSIKLDNFADGVAFIPLTNVEKQIKARDLADLGKRKYSGDSSCST